MPRHLSGRLRLRMRTRLTLKSLTRSSYELQPLHQVHTQLLQSIIRYITTIKATLDHELLVTSIALIKPVVGISTIHA